MDGYNIEGFGQCEVERPDFRAVAKVGAEAPDFDLPAVDGRRVRLSALRGAKRVVLEFGSIT
jgi:uncharacterized protein YccT (UPF0319 family)